MEKVERTAMSGPASTPKTSRMKIARLVAVAIALALVAAACGSSSSDTIVLGDDSELSAPTDNAEVSVEPSAEAVSFFFDSFDGETLEFSEFAEGPVVLNFFANWCATCVAELPDFETVSQNFAGEVQFLGLSFQDRPEDSLALIEETGVTFQTGLDTNGGIFQLFGGLGMPTTVFIDADGQVVNVHSGVLTEESLTEAIETDLLASS